MVDELVDKPAPEKRPSNEINLKHAAQDIRDLFHKGLGAMERGNLDYAIDLFLHCIKMEPRLLDLRKYLRAAQIKKFKASAISKAGPLAHVFSTITGLPLFLAASLKLSSNKTLPALVAADKLLTKDPLNIRFITLFCRAAEAADLRELAIQTLTIARDNHPSNTTIVSWLGNLHMDLGRPKTARTFFQAVVDSRPSDGEAIRALKNAMAMESISVDGWAAAADGAGDYRDLLKDSEQAELLEKEDRVTKTQDDIETLIAETLAKIEQDPDNVNYRRALANLYASNNAFDDAIATLHQVQEMRGGSDPVIDATVTAVHLKQFDHRIEQLVSAGDEASAEAQREEKETFHFTSLEDRTRKYPNDLSLRFEFAVALFKRNMMNESIQQFQLAQRHPRWRSQALYHLGLAFKAKRQFDLASEQLLKASSELTGMDGAKKDILYELGLIEEELDNLTKAGDYYKQIYQTDIGYKDVADKVERIYSADQ